MLSIEEMVVLICRTARLASTALEKHDVYANLDYKLYNDRKVATYTHDTTTILIRSYLSGQIQYEATIKGKDYKGSLFDEE